MQMFIGMVLSASVVAAPAQTAAPHVILASEAGTMGLMAFGLVGMAIADIRRRIARRPEKKGLHWIREF